MTDYIDQAYRYLTSQQLLESTLFTTIGSFIQGAIVFMYALISVLTIVFLDKILKETQQYTGIYIITASFILIFRQLSSHFRTETDNYGKKQTKRSIDYLLSKDIEAVNYKYQNYSIGMEMSQMYQEKRKSQAPLLNSPYKIYLEQHARLEKERLKNKMVAKVFEMLSSLFEFILLTMLKIFKSKQMDVWQFEILVTVTLMVKVIYLFGFQIIYRVIIRSYVLEGKSVGLE